MFSYELWDQISRNLLGTFASEDLALAAVRDSGRDAGGKSDETLVLIRVGPRGGLTRVDNDERDGQPGDADLAGDEFAGGGRCGHRLRRPLECAQDCAGVRAGRRGWTAHRGPDLSEAVRPFRWKRCDSARRNGGKDSG